MRIIVTRDLAGYGWHAHEENYDGPPMRCGFGWTQHDAIIDLLGWCEEDADLSDITVLEDA
jgi:hypothetical protein